MIINVTDKLRIHVDSFKNHQPQYFKEGGEEITFGKHQGQLSKGGWKYIDKHFQKLSQALHWCVENGYADGDALVNDCEITVEGYIQRLESVYNRTQHLLNAIK